MQKIWKSSVLLIGGAVLGVVALSGTTAEADVTMNVTADVISSVSETVTTNMNFGTIDLIPAGDTIRINAAGVGGGAGGAAAVPVATGASIVVGGTSGLITITGAIGFDIDVVYPGNNIVTLTDGTTSVFVNNIDQNSGGGTTDGTITHGAGTNTLIHVGGQIILPAGATTGTYTGSFNVVINYS